MLLSLLSVKEKLQQKYRYSTDTSRYQIHQYILVYVGIEFTDIWIDLPTRVSLVFNLFNFRFQQLMSLCSVTQRDWMVTEKFSLTKNKKIPEHNREMKKQSQNCHKKCCCHRWHEDKKIKHSLLATLLNSSSNHKIGGQRGGGWHKIKSKTKTV